MIPRMDVDGRPDVYAEGLYITVRDLIEYLKKIKSNIESDTFTSMGEDIANSGRIDIINTIAKDLGEKI